MAWFNYLGPRSVVGFTSCPYTYLTATWYTQGLTQLPRLLSTVSSPFLRDVNYGN